jgi:hypothetical protein
MFTFDNVFGSDSTQDDVYTNAVLPLVGSCFEGYNVTILAYGQTGSGKTYTMGSMAFADDDGEEDQGACLLGLRQCCAALHPRCSRRQGAINCHSRSC